MPVLMSVKNLQISLVFLQTYHDDGECSDGVIRELQFLLHSDLNTAVDGGLLGGPVAVALDPSPLLKVGQHDNGGHILLPHHAPEVHNAVRNRALSGDECIRLLVTLWRCGGAVCVLGRGWRGQVCAS